MNDAIADWRLPIANWPRANQQLEIGIVKTEEGFRKSAIGNWKSHDGEFI
jgi:hypothetical protein